MEVKQRLDLTRKKEWSNWNQFGAVQVLRPEDQEQFFRDHPEAEVIPQGGLTPTRQNQTSPQSTRVVWWQEDLEKNNQLRTDSPTTSQLFST